MTTCDGAEGIVNVRLVLNEDHFEHIGEGVDVLCDPFEMMPAPIVYGKTEGGEYVTVSEGDGPKNFLYHGWR